MTARLTRLDWLDRGLKVLALSGAAALKAEPLAASLKVSRGSFYWHFRDIERFHSELLARWRQRATDDIIALINQENSRDARLQLLMRIALAGDDRLERSIRSWASQNATAADAVASVDKIRVEYLSQLLKSAGIPDKRASARATFIYWAYAGRVMVAPDERNLDREELDAIAQLMQS